MTNVLREKRTVVSLRPPVVSERPPVVSETRTVLSQRTKVLLQEREVLSSPSADRRRSRPDGSHKDYVEVLDSNDNPKTATIEKEIVMSTSIKAVHRSLVRLNLPTSVPALITYTENILKRMTGNASFATPSPSLATITTAVDDLRAAEAAAISRLKGAAAARNDKRKTLVGLLQQLRSYVQSVADADEGNGPAIIESAGLVVRKRPTHKARVFAAKPGRISGVVTVLAASAGQRASYEWQYSADGGKTWVLAPVTLQAKTTIAGLTPGAVMQFRYRAVTKAGEPDWSAPVSLAVP
jgi:hypothetical protein